MKLTTLEFNAMRSPARQLLQRRVEYPLFRNMGLDVAGKDVLELGCGSGYGAALMLADKPHDYVGVDVMPEQIALAHKRGLEGAVFQVQDATDLSAFPDTSRDIIVIFGILHHIPDWPLVLKEAYRVLRPDGMIFLEEPESGLLTVWDKVFKWGHPTKGRFSLRSLELTMENVGFEILARKRLPVFGWYSARRTADARPTHNRGPITYRA